ncbi:MAG: hypothetical protein RLW62_12755 [Gammaproteobacteria bacterium]
MQEPRHHASALAALGLVAALAAPAAQALTASAEATIDWNNLTLDFLSGAGTLGADTTYVQTWRFAPGGGPSVDAADAASDWTSSLVAALPFDDGTTLVDVVASADTAAIAATAHVDSPLGLASFGGASQSAHTWRAGNLEALADGMLLVTVPFALSVVSDEPGLGVYAYASLSVSHWNPADDNTHVSYSAWANATVDEYLDVLAGARSGLLSLAVPLVAGETFALHGAVDVSMYAPVPLPPLVWLPGACAAMLLGARRVPAR